MSCSNASDLEFQSEAKWNYLNVIRLLSSAVVFNTICLAIMSQIREESGRRPGRSSFDEIISNPSRMNQRQQHNNKTAEIKKEKLKSQKHNNRGAIDINVTVNLCTCCCSSLVFWWITNLIDFVIRGFAPSSSSALRLHTCRWEIICDEHMASPPSAHKMTIRWQNQALPIVSSSCFNYH